MPNVDKGKGSVETYSCPCPALPEGMMVVRSETLRYVMSGIDDHWAEYPEHKKRINEILVALGEKP